MDSTQILPIDITFIEQAEVVASRNGRSDQGAEAGGQVARAVDTDVSEKGMLFHDFVDGLSAQQSGARTKVPLRRRRPQRDDAIQLPLIAQTDVGELDLESATQATSLSAILVRPPTPTAAAPCQQGPVDPGNVAVDVQVDLPSANAWTLAPSFDLRGDDVRIETYASLIGRFPKDLKIYSAMLNLADDGQRGTPAEQDCWSIRVGYTEICSLSGCCKRALGRAWPRLERLGIVVCIEEHKDRREKLYLIRAPEWLERECQESGCTHYRVTPKGLIQPFRPRAEEEKQGNA